MSSGTLMNRQSAYETIARAVRGQLHRRDGFAKGRRPGIEMVQSLLSERGHLEVALHGVHFSHAVGDGRAVAKHDSPAAIGPLDVLDFRTYRRPVRDEVCGRPAMRVILVM